MSLGERIKYPVACLAELKWPKFATPRWHAEKGILRENSRDEIEAALAAAGNFPY